MCYQNFRIKSVNPDAPNRAFVPCGKCKECRSSMKSAWMFRLTSELLDCQRKGWKFGFITLTYRDGCLPTVPDSCFLENPHSVPCFDVAGVRSYIEDVRNILWKRYKVKGLKYMVCSEYGSVTRRPHYHAIFSWSPDLSVKDFFEVLSSLWTARFGFVFPRDYLGGIDSKGYTHLPFEIQGDIKGAARYAAKYCCKDIDFQNLLLDNGIDEKHPDFKNCRCFHIQSKSLGYSYFKNISVENAREFLLNGCCFIGEEKRYTLPVYIRNKILFSPRYVVERLVFNGSESVELVTDYKVISRSDSDLESCGYRVDYKRLVRRDATQIFKSNYEYIFNRQLDVYEDLFRNFDSLNFWVNKCDSVEVANYEWQNFRKVCSSFGLNGKSYRQLASDYVSLYGLNYESAFEVEPCLRWYLRYDPKVDTSTFDLLPRDFWYIMQLFGNFVFNLLWRFSVIRTSSDVMTAKIADWWKSNG